MSEEAYDMCPTDDLTSTVMTELANTMTGTCDDEILLQKSTMNQLSQMSILMQFLKNFIWKNSLRTQIHSLLRGRGKLPAIYHQSANACKNLQLSCDITLMDCIT